MVRDWSRPSSERAHEQTFTYDREGRLIHERCTVGPSRSAEYRYDPNGNMLADGPVEQTFGVMDEIRSRDRVPLEYETNERRRRRPALGRRGGPHGPLRLRRARSKSSKDLRTADVGTTGSATSSCGKTSRALPRPKRTSVGLCRASQSMTLRPPFCTKR